MASHAWLHRRHRGRSIADIEAFVSSVVDPIVDSVTHPNNHDPGSPPQPMTVTQQVFVTLPATFDGPVGAMSTLNPVATPNSPVASSTPAAAAATTSTDTNTPSSIESTTSVGSSSLLSSSVRVSTSTSSSSGSATSATAKSPTASPATANSPAASPAAASATPASPDAASPFSQNASTGGLSSGSKAGIAIGIILLVGVLAILFFICLRQRKKATGRQSLDDEKSTGTGDTSAGAAAFAEDRVPSLRSVRTASTAPRLSLRPVTQFQPNLTSNRNTGIAMSPVSQLSTASHSAEEAFSQSAVERPASSESQNKTDPFGTHADPIDSANVAESPIISGVGPGGNIAAATSPETDAPGGEIEGAATSIGVATTIEASTATSAGLTRSASKLGNGPKPLDLTRKPASPELPSPAVSDFSVSSDAPGAPMPTPGAAAIAAAGGPPNSTVHRVQLDFSPSMDDELPLRSGQLVRLLHEYDDGWALCIRLDRSAQGVVPRTCLSMRPVKPRVHQPRVSPPASLRPGPPPHQGHPAPPATGMGQRSASPAGGRPPMGRPSSPYNAKPGHPLAANGGPQYNPQSRPMTSTGVRPSSPASHRSQSPAQQTRRNSPPGPSPMAQDSSRSSPTGSISRKPVSGQAM